MVQEELLWFQSKYQTRLKPEPWQDIRVEWGPDRHDGYYGPRRYLNPQPQTQTPEP